MINTLDRDTLLRQMAQMKERIKRLEQTLQGQEVSGVKIKNINWDKGSGGTLRLGGENDVEGSLEVYDSFNQLKAKLNQDGLAFSNNVSGGGASASYQFFQASPGGIISPTEETIEFKNTTEMLCIITTTAFGSSITAQPTYSGNGIITLEIDSVERARVVRIMNEVTSNFNSMALMSLQTITAGSHTLRFRGWCDTGNTCQLGFYYVTYAYIDVGATF